MRKGIFILATLCMVTCLLGCVRSKKVVTQTYTVGIDPNWSPLSLRGKERNLTAFMQELVREAAERQGMRLRFINREGINLRRDLDRDEYDLMLTTLMPHAFYANQLDFSPAYFKTGPVLVVRENFTPPKGMKGKFVGVSTPVQEALTVQAYPGALIRFYHQVPVALDEVILENRDGVMVSTILAHAYVADFFAGQLKIVSEPIGIEGIRLVSKKGRHASTLKAVSQEIERLKKEGVYKKLLRKWSLMPSTNN